MRLLRAIIIAAACAMASAAVAGPHSLAGDLRWIAFASRQDLDEAIGVARAYMWRFPTVRVMQATNGWYAIVAGPEHVQNPRTYKEKLVNSGGVAKDLLFSKGDAYVAQVWKPTTVVPLAQVKYDGKKPATLRYGDLTVTVASAPDRNSTDRVPVATGHSGGRVVFNMRLDEVGNTDPTATLTLLHLDPTSHEPQAVFESHWGGAHCCTMTKIATAVGETWHVLAGRTLDGGGYGFEDIDEDGAYELVNVDNSFLYAFTSYAESRAPAQVSKLVGARIEDVTRDPKFLAFNRQQLHQDEYSASLEPSAWQSNGFLAAWVASKALVGEFDDAWSRMLTLYDRSSDWPLTECTVPQINGQCPQGRERQIDFPTALRKHLEERGYIPKGPAPPRAESVAVARPAPLPAVPSPAAPPPSAPQKTEKASSSGTGFFVTTDGHLVTNNHVVAECSEVSVRPAGASSLPAHIVARDTVNDLALVKVDQPASKIAAVRTGIRLGESVAAFGYPLASVLASSGNFTLGNVTALAGIGDDTRYLQISAPVQPGNSGGPLLDESGNLVGVVTSKLNALRTVVAIGDVPQNVNFAIKASALANFLESNRVAFATASETARLSPPDLAERAHSISAFIKCN